MCFPVLPFVVLFTLVLYISVMDKENEYPFCEKKIVTSFANKVIKFYRTIFSLYHGYGVEICVLCAQCCETKAFPVTDAQCYRY